jgi:hypothetical protein
MYIELICSHIKRKKRDQNSNLSPSINSINKYGRSFTNLFFVYERCQIKKMSIDI